MPISNKNSRHGKLVKSASAGSNATRLQKEVYRLELVRLKGEALALSLSLNGQDMLPDDEQKAKKELLELLFERVKLFVHLTEAEYSTTEMETSHLKDVVAGRAKAEEDEPKALSLLELRGENGDVPADVLSLYLARALREELKPVLLDQLSGLDSPIAPPEVITQPLAHVLNEYMSSLPPHKASSHVEFGKALLALQRGLAIRMIAELVPICGREAREMTLQATSSLASASSFELVLYRIQMFTGTKCTVLHGGESVELHVSANETFLQLCIDAARYWHLDPSDFAVGDQHGNIFMPRMEVLEAVRLVPTNTKLSLVRKTLRHRASGAGAMHALLVSKAKHAKVPEAHLQVPEAQLQVSADKEGALFDGPIDTEDFAGDLIPDDERRIISQGPRTRSALVQGLVRVIILLALIFLSVHSRTDTKETYQSCSSLRARIIDAPLRPGTTSTFNDITNPNDLATFVSFTLPYALWPVLEEDQVTYLQENGGYTLANAPPDVLQASKEYAESVVRRPRVNRQQYLMGGVRIRQQRIRPVNSPQCVERPFMPADEEAKRSTFTEAQTQFLSIVSDTVAGLGWEEFLKHFPVERIIDAVINLKLEDLSAEMLALSPSRVGLGLAAGEPGVEFLRGGPPEARDLAANITRAASVINATKSIAGDAWLCYPQYSDDQAEKEDFGPLRNGSETFVTNTIAPFLETAKSEGSFMPESSTDFKRAPGLLTAWQYRTSEDIGDVAYYRPFTVNHDSSGFTFHVNGSSREDYQFVTRQLLYVGWLDRASRNVFIDMNFLDPNTMAITNVEMLAAVTHAGAPRTEMLCGTIPLIDPLSSEHFLINVPDLVLAFWVLLMSIDTLKHSFVRRGVGWVYVRSGEQFLHWFIVLCCGGALYLRYRLVAEQHDLYYRFLDKGLTSFDSRAGHAVFCADISGFVLATAFWLGILRLSFYYSIFSTRFYLLRKAVNCITELIPALALVGLAILGFAFFAHGVFGSTAAQWATVWRSISNLLAMLRKPSRMRLDDMEVADPLRDMGIEGITGPLFFIMFTFVISILLTALGRSVVIHAYSRAIEEHDGSTPPDIVASSPWPTLNPLYHLREKRARASRKVREARIAIATRISEWENIEKQKKLQAEEVKRLEESRTRRMKEKPKTAPRLGRVMLRGK
ncbi:hypothetical protein AB1Y20_005170 [Prymnesium parvum]|uniref:Polycystin cation channel PKD1/PKD2 domain-containing protein n=1 Tax=Prymnesium parvum TaxID=97485 RepID=A0AB34J2L2_PRYPA